MFSCYSLFPALRYRGLPLLTMTLAAVCVLITTRGLGEESIEVNGFSGSSFSLGVPETFSESRISPLGSYQFTASTNSGGISRANGKIALQFTGTDGAYRNLSLDHAFDQPVDLSAMDYIAIDLAHSLPYNPVERIQLQLESGSTLEIANTSPDYLLAGQKKFPIYDLKARSGVFRLHPSRVKRLQISLTGGSSMVGTSVEIDAIRVVTIARKPPVFLAMTLGGIRDVVVKTHRPLGSNELYRLEASHDLVNWFDKGNKTRGDGGTPVFEKYFNDARFYRLSYYNYVDVFGP